MRKKIRKIAICFLVSVLTFGTMPMNAFAEETGPYEASVNMVSDNEVMEEENDLTGVLGKKGGFSWRYEESTKTLFITGEDSGMESMYRYLPNAVFSNTVNVVFQDCTVHESLNALFTNMEKLESVKFNNFDTSNVTNMSSMFGRCSGLTEVDLSDFDTSSVTDMASMFFGCEKLVELNLSSFDTSKVDDMSFMFSDCYDLKELDLSNFNTAKVTDMEGMFFDCRDLTKLDLSSFDTSNVENMKNQFYKCSSLTEVDLSGFDTSNVTDMVGMFSWCEQLNGLDVSGFDTSNLTDMRGIFAHCTGLTYIDGINFNTSNVTTMNGLFTYCSSLTGVDVSGFDTSKVINMEDMFGGCSSLKNIDVSGFDTSNVTDISGMFALCNNLVDVDVSGFDTSNVTDMTSMFYQCESLSKVNVSGFDTSKVTNMSVMFACCSSLAELDVSNFDTSKVTSMSNMFWKCSGLESLDLSNFDTSNVTSLSYMFRDASNLKNLYISNFDTSNVTDMSFMFWNCNGLKDLDLSGFDTSNVQNMSYMFWACQGLESLNLSSFDTSNATRIEMMFSDCENLKVIYTPKAMVAEQTVSLPDTFYDMQGNRVVTLDREHCNTVLVKECSEYTITYFVNGGTNNAGNPTSYTINSDTITLMNPTKTGYSFDGWYADSDYETRVTQIEKGSGGNKSLYAKWIANTYTIRFDGNGATKGKMNDLTDREYGSSYTLTANAYIRNGYQFAGWNTEANGSGIAYEDEASVKDLTSTTGETVTLYAQWDKNEYTITYKLKGGRNNSGNPSSYSVTTSTITLKNPTKKGYTFAGWYSDSARKKVTQIKKGSTGNKVLYAKWTVNKYNIKFVGNGSTRGHMSDTTDRKYGKVYKLKGNGYTRTGYTFEGWNTKKDGSGTFYRNKATVKNLTSTNGKTVTLYAQWRKNIYTITYKLSGGKNAEENPSVYSVTTPTITLKNPTKKGYTFGGWYTNTRYDSKVTKIKKGSAGNKTLYAKWIKK